MNNDLISRQAAIDAIHGDADWLASQGSDWQVERMERDKSILRSLPSAQPEHKRGRWMLADIYESTHKAMLCNKCNAAYDMTIAGGMFNYCPHCGADMREGEQDEH